MTSGRSQKRPCNDIVFVPATRIVGVAAPEKRWHICRQPRSVRRDSNPMCPGGAQVFPKGLKTRYHADPLRVAPCSRETPDELTRARSHYDAIRFHTVKSAERGPKLRVVWIGVAGSVCAIHHGAYNRIGSQ